MTGVVQVNTSYSETVAVRSDGTLWAWGPNFNGDLGVGTTESFVTTPAQVVGLTGVTQATAALSSIVAVAAAPRPTGVTVPNVLGLLQTEADGALAGAGLTSGPPRFVDSCGNVGRVLAQDPAPGAKAVKGSAVTLTVGARPKHRCP